MTAPNQPAPTWMAALGLGAFQIGGSGGGSGLSKYGQGIDESFVNNIIYGPVSPSNLAANSGSLTDLIPVVQQMITGVPITVLKYLQPFIPGATDADFADSATAAAFITATFIPKMVVDTTNWVGRFTKDTEILFDVFHTTYPVGTPTDPAGHTSWYAAWNDLMALVGLTSGTTPTTPAPTIGTAITAAGTAGSNGSSWSTRLTNDLTVLLDVFHLTYTVTQWNAAWTDLLALFGIVNSVTAPTNPTPTIGPAITSAQASATTATTNAATAQTTANTGVTNAASAQTTANTGVTNAATAQTKANTASTWATRLTNNLLVLSDVFHLTYAAGSPSDPPGTLSGGKPTWYSCWNDLLSLTGSVNAVTAPTDTAPTTGSVIAANTASATTAGTNASIAISNASAANTLAQGTIDGLNSAWSVGGTGNPVSSIPTIATAIPSSAVVGTTPASVAFGAVGAGSVVVGSATSHTASESHPIKVGDLGVVAFVSYSGSGTGGGTTYGTAVTYDGNAMTKITSVSAVPFGTNILVTELWWYKFPSVITANASKTVVAVLTATGGSGTSSGLFLNSTSASGSKISSFGTGSGGGGTSMSLTVPSSTGKLVATSFFMETTSTPVAWGTYSQTQDYSVIGTSTAADMGIVVGHAAGASSLTFSDTTTKTQYDWLGLWAELSN